jgi:hypothetical protein
MALNDFHKDDCKCPHCYDPVLIRPKVPSNIQPNQPIYYEVKNESAIRKGKPLFSGCLMYFPDALMAVAEHSRKANDKHNPGQPLHWSKDKSKDHADCIARHLTDIGPNWNDRDPEFDSYHATALAWRALALLQTVIDREKASK